MQHRGITAVSVESQGVSTKPLGEFWGHKYLVHVQVIREREVLVAVPAHVSDGVRSLALTQEVTRGELRGNGRRPES